MSDRASSAGEIVRRLLEDPPVVHAMDQSADPRLGVWSTAPDCYEFIADRCGPGTRSLETGAGLSTVLFAALGTVHTCVTPSADEAARVIAYCRAHSIDHDGITFAVGASAEVLPGLSGELDFVLIDGSHGYPAPILDWYYAAGRLRRGGVVVLDDVQLPAVGHLVSVLRTDPRWAHAGGTGKWLACRRCDEGPLGQDWFEQPWLAAPVPTDFLGFTRRVAGRLRRAARRAERPRG